MNLQDYTGRTVNVPDEPERIVSFSPAITEILFELGLGDRVVGVSAFCARPKETKNIRKVGSYGGTSNEVLEEIRPDLILAVSGFQKDFALKLSEKFPVYIFETPSSVSGIIDLISRVGAVTGRIDESKYLEFELSRFLGSMRRHPAVSGYLEIDSSGPVTFGALSYITDALSMLGIESIYRKKASEWVSPDLQYVMESDPDIIIYEPKMYSCFSDDDAKNLISERKWGSLNALSKGNFYVTPGKLDFFAHHGPSFIREVLPWTMEILDNL